MYSIQLHDSGENCPRYAFLDPQKVTESYIMELSCWAQMQVILSHETRTLGDKSSEEILGDELLRHSWTVDFAALFKRQTILQFYNAFRIMPSLFCGCSKHSRWLIDCSSSSGSSFFNLKGGQSMTFHAKGRLPILQSEPNSLCSECTPNFLSLDIDPQ